MRLPVPKWLVRRLVSHAVKTPYYHLPGYMNRYWLVPYVHSGSSRDPGCGPVSFCRRPIAWGLQRFGIAVRIHEILRSDLDRTLHDHPWPYVTVLLDGMYFEVTRNEDEDCEVQECYGPGDVLVRGIEHKHRLVLNSVWGSRPKKYQPVTTLFITGPYRQKWGFFTPTGKVPHDEYLAAKSRSRKMAEAGYTRRLSAKSLPSDE